MTSNFDQLCEPKKLNILTSADMINCSKYVGKCMLLRWSYPQVSFVDLWLCKLMRLNEMG